MYAGCRNAFGGAALYGPSGRWYIGRGPEARDCDLKLSVFSAGFGPPGGYGRPENDR